MTELVQSAQREEKLNLPVCSCFSGVAPLSRIIIIIELFLIWSVVDFFSKEIKNTSMVDISYFIRLSLTLLYLVRKKKKKRSASERDEHGGAMGDSEEGIE